MSAEDFRVLQDIANTLLTPLAHASIDFRAVWRRLQPNNQLADAQDCYNPIWIVTKQADTRFFETQGDVFRSGDRTSRSSTDGDAAFNWAPIHTDAKSAPRS